MWWNEEVVWCTSCRELVPHKRQTHTKSMFSIVLGIRETHVGKRILEDFQYKSLDVTVFSDQLPYAGSRAGGRAGGRAGSELD